MNPALWFLVRRSLVNAVRSRLARLKSPRYLVPFVVGFGYFLLVFGPWRSDMQPPASGAADRRSAILYEWLFTSIGFLMAASAWVLPSRGPPLAFLEAEVALLFPAPLARRELVQYKLLDIQKYLVFSVLFFGLLNSFRSGPVRGLMVFLGGWLALNVLTLHQIGARFTRQSLLEHGWSGLRRQAATLGALAALAAVVLLTAPPLPSLPTDRPGAFFDVLADWLEQFGESPAGRVLYPFRSLARPFLAADLPSFLLRTAILGALAVLLYLWVVRSDVAFEEAAAAQAQVLARRIEAYRKGRGLPADREGKPVRRSPWRLSSSGPPEIAFVWKSATESLRGLSPRLLMLLIPAVVLGVAVAGKMASGGGGSVVAGMAGGAMLLFAGLLVLGGPAFLGSNLRTELENVEALKCLPLRGARLVRSSLAGTVAPTAALQVLLVLGAAALLPAPREAAFTVAWRIAGAASLAMLLPCLTALSASADAAGPLFLPAWVKPGQAQAQGGVEGMGYGIVTALGKMLLLLFGAAVPGAAGAALVLAAVALWGPVVAPGAVILGAGLTAAAVLGEVFAASEILGRRFERLDPAAEGMIP